ncbi:phospholipase C, phosphocholine-specific [Paucibacter sp. PLA-PC-4]|uniref:phosphocholine-specific phospholipase C n=1 Tax=Paucibacter sp. PLA-PC-4 TaxID=2993655 RepID=UPI0022495E3A|nr:phospholipase C, phosphocholine-specific [Paucibacter sp. PLA-PC-4]MCX2860250.1 phospholipase C, phosphocholine-specific [Paucibacter sp. PLA-PC-4]
MKSQQDRRSFLRSLAAGAGASAALASFPPAIQRALAIPANHRSGTLNDVEHIVILTQENRSFDHYFGTLAGVRGFSDPFPVPVLDRPGTFTRKSVFVQPIGTGAPVPGRPEWGGGRTAIAPFHLNTEQDFSVMRVAGTPHSWPDSQAAWDLGRMNNWPKAKQNHSMGHYARADLPFQFALAEAFTLCDHYHCATQTGTNTNRLFLWTGHNDPLAVAGGPSTDNSRDSFNTNPATDYTWITYVERLQDAGISWQVYQNMADNFTDNPLAGFRPFRDAWYQRPGYSQVLRERGVSTRDLDKLKADVLADKLPQVSWIVATAEGSEHPGPSSPASGADYTARVLDALTANPEVWSKTVFLVNFDENDGFFDHMPPPAAPSYELYDADPSRARLAGASTVDTVGEYHHHLNGSNALYHHRPYGLGPRVPMYVISPWSKGGWVNSQVADHSSVLRFIEARFGVQEPLISPWRRAVSGDLQSCFDFRNPEDQPFIHLLPETAALRERARALTKTKTPATPSSLTAPLQEEGVRPARALPYELQVQARQDGASLLLRFENEGEAGAVFHVYDRLALGALPRRYTVEAGKQLEGRWTPATGSYDLWVLGPNGFHRHFTGSLTPVTNKPRPEIEARSDRVYGELLLRLHNHGTVAASFELRALKYSDEPVQLHKVAAGASLELRLPLAESRHWYDLSVKVRELAGFSRRLAGHIETGEASISDPALGGPAVLDQYRP